MNKNNYNVFQVCMRINKGFKNEEKKKTISALTPNQLITIQISTIILILWNKNREWHTQLCKGQNTNFSYFV